jgi:hypothetical protein
MSLHLLCLLCVLLTRPVRAQILDHVVPISIVKSDLTRSDSTSLVLTAIDYNFYIGQSTPYTSTIQIVDAQKPWPPRWFTSKPFNVNEYTEPGDAGTLLDASVQNDKLTFFSLLDIKSSNGDMAHKQSYLSCNKNMMLSDTFTTAQSAIDGHDFKVSPAGEKLFFLPREKKVDMTGFTHESADTAVHVLYEEIQIADKKGKIVFQWDPMQKFGLEASYLPYRFVEASGSGGDQYSWSNGNSLAWDEDGNILYSFKNIGIGKISRTDGHIIWRIDRSRQKINKYSDELPIYLQHSFQWVKGADGGSYYTVLSNGDSLHPHCIAYQFTVKVEKDEPVVKIIKAIRPSEDLPNTLGGGNYEESSDGRYVFNYGAYWAKDPNVGRPVFEYGDKTHVLAKYTVPYTIICYKVHSYESQHPPRPVIKATGNVLTATGLKNYKWYKLSGNGLTTVKEVGVGTTFQAKDKGVYCVTAKYGIGCSVSETYEVK